MKQQTGRLSLENCSIAHYYTIRVISILTVWLIIVYLLTLPCPGYDTKMHWMMKLSLRFGSVLFNGIANLHELFNTKAILVQERWFNPKLRKKTGISRKSTRLEFEPAYYEVTLQHVHQLTSGSPWFSSPLWPGVVVPVWVPSMGKIDI